MSSQDPKKPVEISDEALAAALAEHRVPAPSPDFVDETLFRVQLAAAQKGDGRDQEKPEFVDSVMERLIADPVVGARMRQHSERSVEESPTEPIPLATRRFFWLPVAGLAAAAAAAILIFSLIGSPNGNASHEAWPLGAADVVTRATSVAYSELEAEAVAVSDAVVDVPLAPLDADPGALWR